MEILFYRVYPNRPVTRLKVRVRVVFQRFDEAQDIKAADGSVRKETVHGLLLLSEDPERRFHLDVYEQLHMRLPGMKEHKFAAHLLEASLCERQSPEPRAVDLRHVLEVEDEACLAGRDQSVELIAKLRIALAQDKSPMNVEDGDSSPLASFKIERHAPPSHPATKEEQTEDQLADSKLALKTKEKYGGACAGVCPKDVMCRNSVP